MAEAEVNVNDSKYGVLARDLLRWLRGLEKYDSSLSEITPSAFQDAVSGKEPVSRYANFTTTAREYNQCLLVGFAWSKGQGYQAQVAVGNDAVPANVTEWTWGNFAQAQALKDEFIAGTFHPEAWPAVTMQGEKDRWPGVE